MPSLDDRVRSLLRPVGKIPSGLYILGAAHEGRQCAMLSSWVQQAAFSPPTITVALAKDRAAIPLIRQSGRFALSILAEANGSLLKRYARETLEQEAAFEGLATTRTSSGLTVLRDALGYLDARVLQWVEFGGDHLLLIGEVTGGELFRDARPFVHLRGAGSHY